jgi:hypothetical protein
MKSDITLRLGRVQYRQLAEQAKQAGICLEAATIEELRGNWGMFQPMASAVHENALMDSPFLQERVVISVSTTVDTARLRGVQRPEIDWAQLNDDEIFQFVVSHEIGHFVDNHFFGDVWGIQDRKLQAQCQQVLSGVNEVLADRYAWSQVRPGEPVPLCENGKRREEEVAEAMALLDMHAPRKRRAPRTLPGGQYSWVPQSMLMSDQLTAYVGPRVAPALVERARESRRIYRRDTRSRARA